MTEVLTSKKSTPEAASVAALRVVCQVDLYALARVLYRHLTPNLLTEALHKPLCDWMQATPYDENLYLLSRGFFKSSIITTTAVIQRILGDPATWWCQQRWRGRMCGPNTRILIASNKGENAEGFLAGIKGHLESNETLLTLFPEILVRDPQRTAKEWTVGSITVTRSRKDLRESTIQTIGVTGELVSKHYDHGVFDDVVAAENSLSRSEREKVWAFLNKARPLFDPGATRDYVGTHWDDDDAYARLRRQRERGEIKLGLYTEIAWRACAPHTPGGADVPGHGWREPTFPERMCMEKADDTDPRLSLLAEWRRSPSDFNAQYLLDPVSADTAHFPAVDHNGTPYLDLVDAPPPLEDLWCCMAVDPAQSLETWADYSAIAVGGFDRIGDLWILELWQARRNDEALITKIYDLDALCRSRGAPLKVIGIEAVGFAKGLRHVVTIEGDRRGYYLQAIQLERDTTVTKQRRIGLIQGQWMTRQIHALRSCQALAEWQEQLKKFRMDKESVHDDLLDAVADLYQLRGRPRPKADPFLSDEAAQRARWEQELLRTKPELDQMSLRVAWHHHRAREQDAAQRERATVGGMRMAGMWG